MRKLLTILSFFCIAGTGWGQASVRSKLAMLKRQVEKNHVAARPIDNAFSASVFERFLEQLDPDQDLFTVLEFQNLDPYRDKLDEEIRGESWEFLALVTKLYGLALKRADSIVNAILKKPVELQAEDQIVFHRDWDPSLFTPDLKSLGQKWEKRLKYAFLRLAWEELSFDTSKLSLAQFISTNEVQLREKIRKMEGRQSRGLLDPARFTEDLQEIYLNSIATGFDPHTNYFSPLEKEDFVSDLSSAEFSYGFEIDEDERGRIVIGSLLPGGPAWKTGEIHKNDEILQLQWKGSPPVDLGSMDIEEAETLLLTARNNELSIRIRKADGTVKLVGLEREKVETEDEVARGFFLQGEKKIGYLSLPDFYTSWEDDQGSGCANDIAREIILMKRENMEGLILDLRYNGGGSMYEALQLAGIFIEEGPLLGFKKKDGKLVYLKDPNRGTIYDGPLVLLINNQSASASEALAATLQDYNRAVIIGSPSYGKATMQAMFPLDSNLKDDAESPNGYVKITTGKLYRVNGLTTQWEGVRPDILLPDAFEGLELREKFSARALPSDTARKNEYYKPMKPLPVAELSASSQARVESNENFKKMRNSIQGRNREYMGKFINIPLQAAQFEKKMLSREEKMKNFAGEIDTATGSFKAANHRETLELEKAGSFAARISRESLADIEKDIYIEEAYRVVVELAKFLKK